MYSSTAYQEILDPADPAWCGPEAASLHRRWLLILLAAGVLVGVAAVVMVLPSKPAAKEGNRSGNRAVNVVPAKVAVPPRPEPVAASAVGSAAPATPQKPAKPAAPTGDPLAPLEAFNYKAPARMSHANLAGIGVKLEAGLDGDLMGLDQDLYMRLDTVARRLDVRIDVVSGARTTAEQADLYRRFRQGRGNLAAKPGSSKHEGGLAADVYVGGVALAHYPGAAIAAAELGLGFPVAGEPWHLEHVAV